MKKTFLANHLLINLRMVMSCLIVPFYLASCVGTVEDAEEIIQSIKKEDVQLHFDGITACVATSDKKVQVAFPKAALKKGTADPDEFIYKVYVNGNFDVTVASGAAKNLRSDSNGNFFIEVPSLSFNTLYSFSVRVQEPATGAQDANLATCSVRTMNTKLPVFDGVQEVYPAAGVDGQSTIEVKWNTAQAAEYLLGGVPAAGYRVTKYNIYQSTGGDSPDDMVLISTLTDSTLTPVTKFQATGLIKGQNYYFMVRAVDESGREDKNIRIIGSRTKTPQAVFFSGVSSVSTVKNSSGYSSLIANWSLPSGDFNVYRVFAIPETSSFFSSSSIDPNDPTFLIGEVNNLSTVSYMITGLNANTEYNVFVVACLKDVSGCTTKAGDNKYLSAKTTPPLAPFSGVSQIQLQSGASGLSNVNLVWSPPATASGVCDGIRLFNGSDAIKSCNDPLLATSEACVTNTTISCATSGVSVSNLEPGREYCFGAKVYEQARLQEGELALKCVTTQFESPIFQQTPTCTALAGGNKLKIDWEYPNPEGLFNNFLIIAKKDNGAPLVSNTWINNAKAIYEGRENESLVPLADRYKYYIRSKTTRTYTLSGLMPNTNYQLMVKTAMNVGSSFYYDRGTTILNCKTSELTLDFAGWDHILSVGPRINGLADHRATASDELLYTAYPTQGQLSTVQFQARGIEKETLKTVDTIPMLKVDRFGTATQRSDNGIVQLIWGEFKTNDGKKISQYLFDEGITLGPQDGYYLYRKNVASFSTPEEYENALNQIGGSGSGWQAVNTDGPLAVDGNGRITFTDYLPDGFHPVHGTGSGEFRDKANTGKVIWYTVRFRIDNKIAPFTANVNKDAIVAIIIPPANMASIHHWMANKKNCEVLNKEYDRNNAYRCLYGGLGAKEIDNNYYYDMKGHVLVDRWQLGCNFNRFDEDKYCRKYSSDTMPLINYSPSTSYPDFAHGSFNSTLEGKGKDGDCNIHTAYNESTWAYLDGANNTYRNNSKNYMPNAKKGTVAYNAATNECMMRVSNLLTSSSSNNQSTAWAAIQGTGLEPVDATVQQTVLPKAIANEFLKRVYPTNNDPENKKGIAHLLSSNDSSLPPIMGVTHSQAYYLCQGHDVRLQVGSLSSPPIRKRLLTTNESITASMPHILSNVNSLYKIEHNGHTSHSASSVSLDGLSRYYNFKRNVAYVNAVAGTNYYNDARGACNALKLGGSGYTYGGNRWSGYFPSPSGTSLGGYFRGASIYVTGSYDVSGYNNDNFFDGTEICMSGFGIQDYVSTIDTWLNEKALCRTLNNNTDGNCEISPNSNTLADYESLNAKSWPSTKYRISDKNFYGESNYVNALGNEYSFALYSDSTDALNEFGTSSFIKNQYQGPYGKYPYYTTAVNPYYVSYALTGYQSEGVFKASWKEKFNLIAGEYLNCDSTTLCHQDEKTTLSSLKFPTNQNYLTTKYRMYMFPDFIPQANTFYELAKSTDILKPRLGVYSRNNTSYWSNSSWWYQSVFPYFDEVSGTNVGVFDYSYTSKLDFRWKKPTDITLGNTLQGVRCAVLVELDMDGQVQSVDGQQPE